MALYLGSSEINPVIATIKEVPTEQDLTLMGNELRRACAWSRTIDVSGTIDIYRADGSHLATPITATKGLLTTNSIAIIDGKKYTISYSNGYVNLTDSSNGYTNWQFYNGSTAIRGNSVYFNGSSTPTLTNISDFRLDRARSDVNFIIIDGKLYENSTLIDDSGVWTSIFGYMGLRDGHLCTIDYSSPKVVQLTDFQLTDELYGNSTGSSAEAYYAIDNKVYSVSPTQQSRLYTTLPENVKSFISHTMYFTESNKLYSGSSLVSSYTNPQYALSKTSRWILDNGEFSVYAGEYAYSTVKTVLASNVAGEIISSSTYSYPNNFFAMIKYGDNTTSKETLYTVINGSKAYSSNKNNASEYNITNSSATTITVNGHIYTRDTEKDLVFNYVPQELLSRTFTDSDLLQAYLNAGIIQQNS